MDLTPDSHKGGFQVRQNGQTIEIEGRGYRLQHC